MAATRGLAAREAAALIGVGVRSLHRLRRADPDFPPARRVTERRIVWLRHELEEWLEARPRVTVAGGD